MAKLGFFHLPWLGHLNPMTGLARELAARDHEVVFFNVPELGARVRERGLSFVGYGHGHFGDDGVASRLKAIGELTGIRATGAALGLVRDLAQVFLSEAQPVIEKAQLDLWVVDQLDYAAATLAHHLGAPYVTAVVSLLKQDTEGVPGYSGRPYCPTKQSRLAGVVRPLLDTLDRYRARVGLPAFSYDTIWSELAQICQQPAEFEYPRNDLPECFQFTGPFARTQDRPEVSFPWDWLDQRPLVYASFGTLQPQRPGLFQALVEASRGLPAQVVFSLGGADFELPRSLPDNLLVVPFAPQLKLLRRAKLAVNHAGMNSVLECLSAGVPMVVAPIAHDHPGVAARVERTGTGLKVPSQDCSGAMLEAAVREVLTVPKYSQAARRFRDLIAQGNGLARAADIVERVLGTLAGPAL